MINVVETKKMSELYMKEREEKILREWLVRPGSILKADGFHNHGMDINFTNEMEQEFRRLFSDGPVNKILIIDDFLANGCAVEGLINLITEAGAEPESVGICIEKGFQKGGRELRERGVNLHSLAIIDSMSDDDVVFREQ